MKIQVCTWKNCKSKFSQYIITRLENDKEKFNKENVEILESSCMGHCKQWPNVIFDAKREEYMNPIKASDILLWKKVKKKKKKNNNNSK